MPRLNQKRGRFLLTIGAAEAVVGFSYAVMPSASQVAALSWMPTGGRSVGVAVMMAASLAIVAAFRSRRSLWWDVVGWKAAMFTPAVISAVWLVTGVGDFLDGLDYTAPWGPFITAAVYAIMGALVWIPSDWPNPTEVVVVTDPANDDGEGPA